MQAMSCASWGLPDGIIAHPVTVDGQPAVVVSPRYASPEHVYGMDFLEPRSDIYCLGLLLHYLLTGQQYRAARQGDLRERRLRVGRKDGVREAAGPAAPFTVVEHEVAVPVVAEPRKQRFQPRQLRELAGRRRRARHELRWRHLLPNALLPLLSILALDFAGLFSSVAVVEVVFSMPGLGADLLLGVPASRAGVEERGAGGARCDLSHPFPSDSAWSRIRLLIPILKARDLTFSYAYISRLRVGWVRSLLWCPPSQSNKLAAGSLTSLKCREGRV